DAQEGAWLEEVFPAQEEELSGETQPTDLAGTAPSPEFSFDRLNALFAEETETEALSLEAGGSLSAMDGEVDLDELSRFFAEREAAQEGIPSDLATFLGEAEALQGSNLEGVTLPEPEPLVAAAEQGGASQPAEEDLASQLESLFTEDELLAAPSATVLGSETQLSEEEAPEVSPTPSLDDLAALFDAAEPAVPPELEEFIAPIVGSPAAVSGEVADDFAAQLESLLVNLEVAPQASAAAPAPSPSAVAAAPATAAPTAPATRRSALSNPVMRVEVRHLDSINNLVGELVVIRNSMEQNQTRLRQFLDGLLGRVQQLGDLGQRMRDQYDRSLLESALFSSRSGSAYGGTVTVGFGRNGEGAGHSRRGHSSGQEFDKLEMDQFTAFHTLAQEIIEL
ncbi:hybrid sensor histidine kinase/response regulator, partial [Synechococcus sp. H55.9]